MGPAGESKLEQVGKPTCWRRAWRLARAALIVLLLAELSLRLVLGLGHPVLYVVDTMRDGCGYLPAPDQEVRRFFCRNHINHLSMRSEEVADRKPDGQLRILFVGDSVTYGTTYVDQAQIFTSRVAQDLPAVLGRRAEVLNVSAGGWAPANEAGYLRTRGTSGADLVIQVLNTADLNQPYADPPGEPGYPTRPPWSALGETWSRYALPWLLGWGWELDPGSLPMGGPTYDIDGVLEALETAQSAVVAAGGRYAIAYTPARSAAWDSPAFQERFRRLERWASRREVPLIDLTADLGKESLEAVYFEGGIHLRPLGHQRVAERLLKELPGLLPTSTPQR